MPYVSKKELSAMVRQLEREFPLLKEAGRRALPWYRRAWFTIKCWFKNS